MTTKIRITWVQVMALLALFGILLGVIGTAWIAVLPMSSVEAEMSPAPTQAGSL